ncbi:MAG: hypothetical protein NTV22_06705, partial [bacterium]|nr:hypothetical protein [bacterium]
PELHGLRIDPCLPSAWPGFRVERRYRGCRVQITVHNSRAAAPGGALQVDGVALDARQPPVVPATLLRGKAAVQVVVGVA